MPDPLPRSIFGDLEPPPHGLVRLRARMRRRRRRGAFWAGIVLGPAAASAAVIAMLTVPSADAPVVHFDHPVLADEGAPGVVVVVDGARVAAVPAGDGVWLVP